MKKLLYLLIFISTTLFAQDDSKYPKGFIPIKNISEVNGNWKFSDDLLKINVSQKTIQFNDGMKLYLDFAENPDYNQFYIYGRIKNKKGRPIVIARARISNDKNKLHLERLDGNSSNIYTKK
jgi:hypothetical protein